MEELPVATVRPRGVLARLAAARGALSRWVRARLRAAFDGRHAPLLLTAIFFSGMMLAMGYVADRAQRAADAIDEAHREAARQREAEAAVMQREALPTVEDYEQDEEAAAADLTATHRPAALFYIRAGDTNGR